MTLHEDDPTGAAGRLKSGAIGMSLAPFAYAAGGVLRNRFVNVAMLIVDL